MKRKKRKFESGDAVKLVGTKKSHGAMDEVVRDNLESVSRPDWNQITGRIASSSGIASNGEFIYDVTIDPKYQKYFYYKGMCFCESDLLGLNEVPKFLNDELFEI